MIDKSTVVLQNSMDCLKVEPGLASETSPTSSHEENHIIDIKIEEDPWPVTFPGIKAEYEVSCMSVCLLLGTFHRYPELCIAFLISFSLSICRHETSPLYCKDFKSSLENVSTGLYFVAHYLWSITSISVWYLCSNYMGSVPTGQQTS
jgi:hypothetical protein